MSVLAASGIRSRMQSLDLLANNLANADTTGYKVDREFYSLFASDASSAGGDGDQAKLPMLDKHWTDFSQGELVSTGNPLDFALSGAGFFAVNGPNGPLYTRNGSFHLSAAGALVTTDGYPLRDQQGNAITLSPATPFQVTPDGAVEQNGSVVAQLDLVTFANPMVLAKQGSNYFRNTDAKAKPVAATGVEVRQQELESSNVNTPDSAVRLVGVMRQFEMLQKAVTMSLDMNKKGIEEVARIPS